MRTSAPLLVALSALSALPRGARGASADIDPFRKPFYVESGASLSPAGAAGFYSGLKCGEVSSFTLPSTQGSKLIVDLVVPSTSNRRQDDRWSMQISTGGTTVYNSVARWCKQPEDDRLDVITLVATRTIHRYPADRSAFNVDWNSSAVKDYTVLVSKACADVLPNSTLSISGQELPSWARDSTLLSKKDGVDNFALWVGDIKTEFLDVGLELTVLTPITIEKAQFWGHVFMLPWTVIPAFILCNIILFLQSMLKCFSRYRDDHDCKAACCIWPMDPPLYFWFAINAMSLLIAVVVNRMLVALIGVAFVPGINSDEVVLIMLYHIGYPLLFVVVIFLVGMLQPHCFCCCVKPPRDDAPDDDSYDKLQIILWIVQTCLYFLLAAATAGLGIGYFVPSALIVCSGILTALNPLWKKLCGTVYDDGPTGMTPHEIELMKKQQAAKMMAGPSGFVSDAAGPGAERLPDYEQAARSATKPGKIMEGEMVL
jgi:hypothetical protein